MQFFNKFFSKNASTQDAQAPRCLCKDNQGVFVTLRHVSWLSAGFIMLSFLGFMAGYFLGQKKIIEQFSTKLEQDSLSDKISSSLCSLYDIKSEAEDSESGESEAEESNGSDPVAVAATHSDENKTTAAAPASTLAPAQETPGKRHYAQLAGFGSASAANNFAQRLAKKNVAVVVKKRSGSTAKGRVRHWYQVVTKPYEKRDTLVTLLEKIKREEHLTDVRVIAC